MLIRIIAYIALFGFIWLGAGIILASVSRLAERMRISSFAFAFFVLGILTSMPELSLGLNAIGDKQPGIFVGNLLGGILAMFLLIIPVLAIVGKKIEFTNRLEGKFLLTNLMIVAAPALLLVDGRLVNVEAYLLIFLYLILFYIIQARQNIIKRASEYFRKIKDKNVFAGDLTNLIVGLAIIFFASRYLVGLTTYFSVEFGVSPFLISLLFLSIGTNLPEMAIGVRSVLSGKKEVALGDYIGSASANVLLLGILTLVNGGEVATNGAFLPVLIFTVLGLATFFVMAQAGGNLSRKEGAILLSFYVLFIISELA